MLQLNRQNAVCMYTPEGSALHALMQEIAQVVSKHHTPKSCDTIHCEQDQQHMLNARTRVCHTAVCALHN